MRKAPARWPLVVLAALLGMLGVGAFVSGGDDSPSEPTPSTALVEERLEVSLEEIDGDEPAPVVIRREPYGITYRVEGSTPGGGAIVDIERRWVRPPYESRVATMPSENEDGAATFLQIARFGEVQTGRESESPVILAVEPTVAPGDARVDVATLEWRAQRRTVLARDCEVYRAGGPIDVGPLEPPTEDSWADLCVDKSGLVLHEEWVIDREVFRRRIATAIDESPSFDGSLFTMTGERVEDRSAGGALVQVTADSQPPEVAHYALPSPPHGFSLRGRYAFTPARARSEPEAPQVASILDVYEDGEGGMVVIDNGGTSDRSQLVRPTAGAERVDLGQRLGLGEIVHGLRQSEVRVGLDGGRFVRVWGTLAVEDLVTLARSLVPSTRADSEVTPIE